MNQHRADWAQQAAKSFFTIHAVDEVESTLARAVHDSVTGEPGPVVVEIPVNILRMRRLKNLPLWMKHPRILHTSHLTLKDTLNCCSVDRPVKEPRVYMPVKGPLLRQGCYKTWRKKLAAPVATTISGRGAVPEDHPLSVGYGFGPTGESAARKIFSTCDVLISVGCKFSEMSSGGWDLNVPEKHIRIDSSPEVLQSNFPGSINLADGCR